MPANNAAKKKAEPEKRFRIDWAGWADRVTIVALGLTIGLCAKWIKQTWQGSQSAPLDSAPEVPGSKSE